MKIQVKPKRKRIGNDKATYERVVSVTIDDSSGELVTTIRYAIPKKS